jgi:20S proteasome subunit beta 2
MGSGSNVDLCVIKANDQVDYFRGYDIANLKGERKQKYSYPKGTTATLKSLVRPIVVEEVAVRPVPMETA